MDTLSPELLDLIASYLDTRSLPRYALVNRPASLATRPYRFREITIKFNTTEQYIEAIDTARLHLETGDGFKYVQRLSVETCNHRELFQGDEFEPLTKLVSGLPVLRDLHWKCVEKIPLQLLRHCEQLRVRLDIVWLELPYPELEASPCLYSAGVRNRHDVVWDILSRGHIQKLQFQWDEHISMPKVVQSTLHSLSFRPLWFHSILSLGKAIDFTELRMLAIDAILFRDTLMWLNSMQLRLEDLSIMVHRDCQLLAKQFLLKLDLICLRIDLDNAADVVEVLRHHRTLRRFTCMICLTPAIVEALPPLEYLNRRPSRKR